MKFKHSKAICDHCGKQLVIDYYGDYLYCTNCKVIYDIIQSDSPFNDPMTDNFNGNITEWDIEKWNT